MADFTPKVYLLESHTSNNMPWWQALAPKPESAPEPSGVPKNIVQNNKSVEEFLIVWGNANPRGKRAIWLWLCDNYEGAT